MRALRKSGTCNFRGKKKTVTHVSSNFSDFLFGPDNRIKSLVKTRADTE